MNPIGIFAKTFQRPTFEEVLDAVAAHGFSEIQLNLSSAGLPTLPDHLKAEQTEAIVCALRDRHLSVAALSGTFNLIDPDRIQRDVNLARLSVLAGFCRQLGASVITVSSGTRNADDMWRPHPENTGPDAWREMLHAFETALAGTEQHSVTLAVEPEPANVVRTAKDACRLMDELQSPRVKCLLDGANLLHSEPDRVQRALFAEAADLLGSDIVLVHAKEYVTDGQTQACVPGRGTLDWSAYLREITRAEYRGPLILHGQPEEFTDEAKRYLAGLAS